MGLGIRVFVLGSDGHFTRMPHTRYEGLWARDGNDSPAEVFAYRYRVSASSAAGTSPYSNIAPATAR